MKPLLSQIPTLCKVALPYSQESLLQQQVYSVMVSTCL